MKKFLCASLLASLIAVGCSSDDSTPTNPDDPGSSNSATPDGGQPQGGDTPQGGGDTPQGGTVYYPANQNGEAANTFYNNWMSNFYVTFSEEVPADQEVYYSLTKYPLLKQSARIKFDQPKYTVSEGIGYGMLSAVFQGDKARFDALMNYYLSFRFSPETNQFYMMWQITGFKSGHGSSASDADLDIAVSLLIAHEKWGAPNGDNTYLQHGIEEGLSIMTKEVNPETHLVVPADAGEMLSTGKVYNISYFSLVAFKMLAMYDTERAAQWNQVLESSIEYMKKVQDAGNGLWPDWCDKDGVPTDPQNGSSTGKLKEYWGLEGVRIPWRLVWYYAWFGDDRVKAIIQKAAEFAVKITGGDINMTLNRYNYQGEVQTSGIGGGSVAYKGAFCALGMIDASYANFLTSCNQVLMDTPLASGTNYFAPSIQLLYLQLLNGHMVR
jgi:endo-1,4-beta-D-glucanase Y